MIYFRPSNHAPVHSYHDGTETWWRVIPTTQIGVACQKHTFISALRMTDHNHQAKQREHHLLIASEMTKLMRVMKKCLRHSSRLHIIRVRPYAERLSPIL